MIGLTKKGKFLAKTRVLSTEKSLTILLTDVAKRQNIMNIFQKKVRVIIIFLWSNATLNTQCNVH